MQRRRTRLKNWRARKYLQYCEAPRSPGNTTIMDTSNSTSSQRVYMESHIPKGTRRKTRTYCSWHRTWKVPVGWYHWLVKWLALTSTTSILHSWAEIQSSITLLHIQIYSPVLLSAKNGATIQVFPIFHINAYFIVRTWRRFASKPSSLPPLA